MNRNEKATDQQVDSTSEQVEAMTQIINNYEQRIHELESAVEQMQKDMRVVTTNKPDTPASQGTAASSGSPKRGRPAKDKQEGVVEA
jgi:chromosome segregation ATPase